MRGCPSGESRGQLKKAEERRTRQREVCQEVLVRSIGKRRQSPEGPEKDHRPVRWDAFFSDSVFLGLIEVALMSLPC